MEASLSFALLNPSGAPLGVESYSRGHGRRSNLDHSLRSRLSFPFVGGQRWRPLFTLVLLWVFLEQLLLVLGYLTSRVMWDPGSFSIGFLAYLIDGLWDGCVIDVRWVFMRSTAFLLLEFVLWWLLVVEMAINGVNLIRFVWVVAVFGDVVGLVFLFRSWMPMPLGFHGV
ncbi:hypothetical protein M0R45_016770 [Rubus argutus]|uniref:Transmembrane protein n=1 Tax=Rubus argutus TaxID=59490 RepID=A0AAW1XW06_RUBAR